MTLTNIDTIKHIAELAKALDTHEIEALRSVLFDIVYQRQADAKKAMQIALA